MLGQIEDISTSIKKSMTNQRKKMDEILMLILVSSNFYGSKKVQLCQYDEHSGEEFLYNLFETKLDGFTFT